MNAIVYSNSQSSDTTRISDILDLKNRHDHRVSSDDHEKEQWMSIIYLFVHTNQISSWYREHIP